MNFGTSGVALGVFGRKGSRLRLDDYAVETYPAAAASEDHWLENTRAALLALRARVKVAGPVVLVLPAHLVLMKFVKTPRLEAAKREKIIRFEAEQNKVPVLGNLPGIGRLFRSEGESSQKRNLLIFVTANLVNPGGSLRKQDVPGAGPGTLYQNPTIVTPAGAAPRGE